ncbi:class I SAM-dependent methyltransferase [Massilia norwichensis]|uniref:Class I SAM-dependent methyltransferase n=1 Tax=Massilia norwichensis TaxID=1442366 RepID=A0ABT2AAW8_9BURK|nr:class I SAM-dependent methyltransferase [Massilia norwichensis]MCS0591265.1 class I SAM-dependent methyltransferase [Massilia norwichensis]
MATQGEFEYFKNIGEDNMRHAIYKPWSDAQCGLYLMELGAMLGLMPEGGRLLDMGCGTGWTSALFARRGYDVVGQDLVADAIDAGRKLKAEQGLANLDFVVGDYESLTFKEEFDIVVFFDCLHHAVDEVAALNSAYRALKPGGICITSEPGLGHEKRSAAIMAEFGTTERDMHPAKIIRAGKKVGFKQFSTHPHAFYLYIALYRREQRGLLGKLMRIPGMRTLVGMLVVLLSKHQAGIVVLRK